MAVVWDIEDKAWSRPTSLKAMFYCTALPSTGNKSYTVSRQTEAKDVSPKNDILH